MEKFKNYKDESRRPNWGTNADGLTIEQIKLGAILRIADATEAMAKNHTQLLTENQRLKDALKSLEYHYTHEKNSNRTLRGQVTKLRKKLEK